MNPSRRDFLKFTTVGGVAAAVFGFDLQPAYAQLRTLKIARASETRSTCPYCAVGCGTIIYTIGDRAKNVTAQVKKTRDETFIEKDAAGHTVNRLESVAWIGGCTDTNEFNYLVVKSMRALGVVHLENQARV